MISKEQLVQKYIDILNNYYPLAGRLLRHCLVRIIKLTVDRNHQYFYYLGIYYPHRIGERLLAEQDILKEVAENMGFAEVVFLNANNLVKDPLSKIKEQDFRFWLELCWIAKETN